MSSSGNRKDVLRLLTAAKKNGAQVFRVPNGHFKVINPDTGKWVQVAWSPRSPHYLRQARQRLEELGVL
jgi:hypothetical protein